MISRQMPDGTIKKYEEGTSEAIMLADFEAMEIKMREENKRLLAHVSAP